MCLPTDFALKEQKLPDGSISLGAGHGRDDKRFLRYRFPKPFPRHPMGATVHLSNLVRVRFLAFDRAKRLKHAHVGKRPEEICSTITAIDGLYGIEPDTISWALFDAPNKRRRKWKPNREAMKKPNYRLKSSQSMEIYLGYRHPHEAAYGMFAGCREKHTRG